jgi:hypothetical protein
VQLHHPDYDESKGLIVINELKGNGVIEKSSQIISRINPDELKTTQYSEFDIIHDFSYLNDIDYMTIMKKP